jgi:hypothetical protein
MKACGARAARMASAATWMLPSVPFLKPTGQLRPEASWRWLWLSVVRAPIAPQATELGDELRAEQVEELGAGRHAEHRQLEQELPGALEASLMAKLPSRCGSLM